MASRLVFSNKAALPGCFRSWSKVEIIRLIGAVLFEQNHEWQIQNRYMQVEAFDQIDKEEIDPILSITTKAA